jgi:hypothetical protein
MNKRSMLSAVHALLNASRLADENAVLSIKLSGLLSAISNGELNGSLWSLEALELFAAEYLDAAHSRGRAAERDLVAETAEAIQDQQWADYLRTARLHGSDVHSPAPEITLWDRVRVIFHMAAP